MGLDIRIKRLQGKCSEDDYYATYVCQSDDFLPIVQCRLEKGHYKTTDESLGGMHFFYSEYYRFRKSLALMVGTTAEDIWSNPENYINTPFVEIINFTDCCGVIDYEVVQRLIKDFEVNIYRLDMLVVGETCDANMKDKYMEYLNMLRACKNDCVISYE